MKEIPEDEIPTEFLGGRDAMLERLNGNTKPILKGILAAVLTLTAMALAITRSGIGLVEDRAIVLARTTAVEAEIQEIKAQTVRKDALEPRLTALEMSVKEMREDQKETNRLLQRLLIDRRR